MSDKLITVSREDLEKLSRKELLEYIQALEKFGRTSKNPIFWMLVADERSKISFTHKKRCEILRRLSFETNEKDNIIADYLWKKIQSLIE
ncbi:hypothetical protein JZ925_08300 [Riemerella anatipestifer]